MMNKKKWVTLILNKVHPIITGELSIADFEAAEFRKLRSLLKYLFDNPLKDDKDLLEITEKLEIFKRNNRLSYWSDNISFIER